MVEIIKHKLYIVNVKSYGQYCALAKALDLVGDRWTLLIVRELSIRGGSRYTDLRHGLPGIATNLLANRLRELERAGVVNREEAPPPIAAALFHLTPRGRELEPVLHQLGRWGAPLLANAPKKEAFRAHWLAMPAAHWLKDSYPGGPPVSMELRVAGEAIAIETVKGSIRTKLGPASRPDLVITGKPQPLAALLAGKSTLPEARAAGLTFKGKIEILGRFIGSGR